MSDRQTTTKGFAILSFAGIINKLLALVYLPIQTLIVGYYGNGIISAGYTIYIFIYSLSNAGIPVAISKLTSEQNALGNYKGSEKIFKVAFGLLICSGIFFGVFMAIGARWISNQIFQPQAFLMLLVLSPAILFTSIGAAFAGYFQGRLNMIPTAISQVIEQVLNSIFTIVFAWLFIKYGIEKAAAGTTLGTTIGTMGSALYLFLYYITTKKRRLPEVRLSKCEGLQLSSRLIIKRILTYCLPAIFGIIAMNLNNLVDLRLCIVRLVEGGIKIAAATELYGVLTNQFHKIFNVPLAVLMALPIALIPAISTAVALKDNNALSKKINESYKAVFIISIPSAVGLAVLAKPIITLVFLNLNRGSDLMALGSWSIVLYAITFVQTAILTGLGKPFVPPINLVIGMLIKVSINYYLIAIPFINIKGAIIGTTIGYLLGCVLNHFQIKKYTSIETNYVKLILKPAIASLIMGIFVFSAFKALTFLLRSLIHQGVLLNDISLIISIFFGVALYLIMLILLKVINENDILKLPIGSKINSFVRRLKFLKMQSV